MAVAALQHGPLRHGQAELLPLPPFRDERVHLGEVLRG